MIKKKGNSVWLGLIAGILLPVIVMTLVYIMKFSGYPIEYFKQQLMEMKLFSKYISVCVYPNLGLFFIFIWANRLLSARGVLMATILLAIVVFILKFSL
jgi:hypothetical protein